MATATFIATGGVVAGIAAGVERLTQDASPVRASFATDVPRTAVELESWRRAVLAGEDTKRELEAAARDLAEEERRKAREARRKAEEARRKVEEVKARKKAEEEARKKAEAEARRKAEAAARKEAEARRKAEEEARKKAEEEAARTRAKEAKSAGSTSSQQSAPSGSPKDIARQLVAAHGWSSSQFDCLVKLWTKESNWRVTAENPSSGAYGIPQALPGSKMATFGDDWRTNPVTQIKWGLDYIDDRYGTPCGAWSHSQAVGWY